MEDRRKSICIHLPIIFDEAEHLLHWVERHEDLQGDETWSKTLYLDPGSPTQKGTQSRNTTNETVHKFNHLRANMIRSDHTWKPTNIHEHIRNYMKLYEHIMYHYVDIVCIYVAMMITCIYTVAICYNHIHTRMNIIWSNFEKNQQFISTYLKISCTLWML